MNVNKNMFNKQLRKKISSWGNGENMNKPEEMKQENKEGNESGKMCSEYGWDSKMCSEDRGVLKCVVNRCVLKWVVRTGEC